MDRSILAAGRWAWRLAYASSLLMFVHDYAALPFW